MAGVAPPLRLPARLLQLAVGASQSASSSHLQPTSSPPPAAAATAVDTVWALPLGRHALRAFTRDSILSLHFCYWVDPISKTVSSFSWKTMAIEKTIDHSSPPYRFFVSIPPADLTVADGASHPPLGTALVDAGVHLVNQVYSRGNPSSMHAFASNPSTWNRSVTKSCVSSCTGWSSSTIPASSMRLIIFS